MRHTPIQRRKRINPKRRAPRRVRDRVKLYGDAKSDLRRRVWCRSKGYCEVRLENCEDRIFWDTFEMAHRKHGARKSDELSEVDAACKTCHRDSHNAGGKPCPRKPGRPMTKREAQRYIESKQCVCGQAKGRLRPLCDECLASVSPQSRLDLSELVGKDFLEAFALAELQLLAK